MSNQNKLRIFISWSGEAAREISGHIMDFLTMMFQESISIYLSDKNIEPGEDGRRSISCGLAESDFGLLVLTKSNQRSPWLMYEAGALSKNVEKARVIPLLFGRSPKQIEDPLKIFQYSKFEKGGYKRILKLIKQATLDVKNLSPDDEQALDTSLDASWGEFEEKINNTLAEYEHYSPINERQGKINNQLAVNISEGHVFGKVYSQCDISLSSTAVFEGAIVLNDIPDKFRDFVKKQIGEDRYKLPVPLCNGQIATILMINSTRISTFVAITDGLRILMFDRAQAGMNHMQRENNRFDVFGAVQFENYSFRSKIGNDAFLQSRILSIKSIPGLAIEENVDENDMPLETVVMFGFIVIISPKDLDTAITNENEDRLQIFVAIPKNGIENLTAKAKLSVKFIQDANWVR